MESNTDKSRTKRRRRKRWVGYIAFLVAVLSAAAVLCLAMFFKTQAIVVEGNQRYTTEELISASGIQLGENVFTVDLNKTARQIKEVFFYLEEVRVVPVLPTTMKITVVESIPAMAVVNSADSYTLLSTGGRIIQQCSGLSTQGLPLVVGTDFSQFPQGTYPGRLPEAVTNRDATDHRDATPLEEEGKRVMLTLDYITRATGEAGLEKVNYVDVSDELSTCLLWDQRVLLKVGTELELTHKLELAKVALKELGEGFTGSMDLSVIPKVPKAYSKEESIEEQMNPIYLENYLKYE